MNSNISGGGPIGPRFGRVRSRGRFDMRNRSFCHDLPDGRSIIAYLPLVFDASGSDLLYTLRLETAAAGGMLEHMVAYKVSGKDLAQFSSGLQFYRDLQGTITDAFGQTGQEDLIRFSQARVFLDILKVFFAAMSANFELGEGENRIMGLLEKSLEAYSPEIRELAARFVSA